jgi:hypothetical protein
MNEPPLPRFDDPTVFEGIYKRFIDDAKRSGMLTLDEILELVDMLQKYELDCHIVVAGQNGIGKSYILLMLLKKALGDKWMDNLMLAKHTTNDLIQFILNNKSTICGIDELNQYLYYTRHASHEQDHLITTFELARSKSIGFVGCIRDPRKVSLNYRDGKMSIVIWIMDRFREGGAIAAVFVTNPVIESFDKFGFGLLPGDVVDFDEMRALFEELPSFVGYLRVPHMKHIFKKGELDRYKKEKEVAMAHAHLNYCVREMVRKRMTTEEFRQELNNLQNVLAEDVIAKALRHLPKKRGASALNQSSMNTFIE